MRSSRGRAGAWLLVLPLLAAAVWLLRVAMAALPIDQGPGGPILVVTSGTSNFGKYYAEMLRTEGLNEFDVTDVANLSAALAGHDVVVLSKMTLTSGQVTTLTDWVNGGGNLIAMAPDPQLAPLLGLTAAGGSVANGYLLVDPLTKAGNGIVNQTMQFHGNADRYTLSGASSIATLYSNATTATANPAVTLRNVANGGQAAAFTYDLATSIVYTRQGNPAWATQERDGFTPIRSDDKFFGAANGDVQADWVDLNKVAIPQADEQQRLLANLILTMNQAKKPLPRFWYFPNGKKAVVIMSGDDHGNGGTAGRFDQYIAASSAGCSVANWECVRSTSYVYPGTPLTNAQAASYTSQGFEVGLHIQTGCSDFTPSSLESAYVQQIGDWTAQFPGIPQPVTQRHHCIVWSDWLTAAKTELNHGMRLDVSYYFWPPSWVSNVPGLFTGSAMPMRVADLDGSLVDVYEATTQMTDESGQTYPFTIDTLLDRALGAEGYYGVYTVNAHTDDVSNPVSDAVLASAQARGVPLVSSVQMLRWLDARNNSSFGSLAWNGNALSFSIAQDGAANGLQAMLPNRTTAGLITGITRNGAAVGFSVLTIKGIEYAVFPATGGSYAATYAVDATPPTVASVSPANGATGVGIGAAVTAAFSEAVDPATVNGNTFSLRDGSGAAVAATVAYVAETRTAQLTPTAALAGNVTYTATVEGGAAGVKDLSGNALASDFTWSFTTASGPSCPCSAWPATATPLNPSVSDPGPVELGVKFRSDVDGSISGIRFYKGAGNTGTHVGNLWSTGGQLLGTATFTNETASGWQQVNFTAPIPIAANTVYVASYFAPAGHYAGDNNFFVNSGVDNVPLHLLKDGVSGGNGVYAYGAASTFPSNTFQSTNYWVDVVFTAETGGADTTPPTVTTTSPAAGATGVGTTSTVTATFSEAIDPATLTAATFTLKNASGAQVSGTVSYSASSFAATLTPATALAPSTQYTATLVGGATDPRIKDVAGNALAANVSWSFTTASGAGGVCASPPNAIVAENCQPGNPESEWDISGAGDSTIQGFATDMSVNRGSTVTFKVKSTSNASFRYDIYRIGYYGGMGARKVATVQPTAAQITASQSQPACLVDQRVDATTGTTSGLIDCGNWTVSGSWAVPQTAVSGVYIARAVRTDTGGASHIIFIVRDDVGTSDLLFETSDTTWQAYNQYGGNSLYVGSPAGRAYKVSYNRPFTTRATSAEDFFFNAEYPMVRWLEANGYDVSYASGIDGDRFGNLIRNHKAFLSVGHDEYWSGGQRTNVEAARNAGVHIGFFSGNEIFWKTRWEPTIDGSGTSYRTLVSYKETHANAVIDPQDPPTWTGTWRDPRFSPPGDGGRPENALSGTIFLVNGPRNDTMTVPDTDGKMRFWRNTTIASLTPGATATLPAGTLGAEWDQDADNGFRPPGLIRLSTTTLTGVPILVDFGSTYGTGTATHHLTLYRHTSGALVFGAGTYQWPWGLDSNHDRGSGAADVRMQQATVNLFADMHAQPATLQSGLVAASASTDTVAPTSTITSPISGATLQSGVAITITGTAADTGGGVVGGVEVSTDNGATWHPANGRASWTYSWTPSGSFSTTIRSRAVDDSGNLEAPGPGVPVTVGSGSGSGSCPCSVWAATTIPGNPSDSDSAPVNLGVKFTADTNGFISGIRFYKGSSNTGTHIGSLWTAAGQLLASATFTNESASGWQQVNFSSPVAITANTVYVASYLAPAGHYAADVNFFASGGVDAPPLHVPSNGASGGNGVYRYSSTNAFPNSTFNATNYWVDVVFTSGAADTTPPTVSATSPANGATNVAVGSQVSATFNEAMDAATISGNTFFLRDAASQTIPATVTYNGATRTATLTPNSALAAAATYTATVVGGTTDPRAKDLAGNALAASVSWSFTTSAGGDTTPPTVVANTPANGATGVTGTPSITATFSEAMDASTINASTFTLRTSAGASVTASVAYNPTTFVATLTPSASLAASTTYTATIVGGASDPRVKDLAGNALAASMSWSFTTGDTTPPTVTTTSPADGATGVSGTANVTATFSEAMTGSTINTTTFVLRDAANNIVSATVSYNGTSRVATLNPAPTLTAGARYTATIVGGSAGVKDSAGNPLAVDKVWSFTVFVDTSTPTVTATSPTNGQTGVSGTANVTATFSEAMDATTITTGTFVLRDAAGSLVSATVSYGTSSHVATLNPAPTLTPGATYTATVVGGASGVKDVAGNALAADTVWSFTIQPDTTAPTVTSTSPADGATGVGRNANVTATFSEAVAPATVNVNTFFLVNTATGARVAATVTLSANQRTATLNANASLGVLTTYTARVVGGAGGVTDLFGNPLATDKVWTFTTR